MLKYGSSVNDSYSDQLTSSAIKTLKGCRNRYVIISISNLNSVVANGTNTTLNWKCSYIHHSNKSLMTNVYQRMD
jgi:hypothetical protein